MSHDSPGPEIRIDRVAETVLRVAVGRKAALSNRLNQSANNNGTPDWLNDAAIADFMATVEVAPVAVTV